jgi:ABC-type molybdate transport system substrate-binding protein
VPQLVLALLLLTGADHAALGQELMSSVAISMKEVIAEVGRQFERAHPGVTLRYNLGASGELQKQIEAGVLYATDAAVQPGRVRSVFRLPAESYPPVTYPVAAVAASPNQRLVQAFIDLLVGREGQALLDHHGFQSPRKADP